MKSSLYLFLLALISVSCGNQDTKKEAALADEGTIPVKLVAVETAIRTEPVYVSGTVASEEEARLSFKVGGIVSRIYVREGQAVRKGQLLAVLNLTEIDAQVSQAQYATEKAERDMKRVQSMLRDTAATLEQMQNATTGFDLAQQQLKIAKFNQAYAQITSPIDGTVTRKLMNEGELAAPGAPALLVSSNRRSNWVVRVGVSDRDWARLKVGDHATVHLDAYPDAAFNGTVTKLAQAADPQNKLYEIEVHIDPDGKRFASGLFAKVELTPSQSRSYTVVPVEALVEGNGREGFVFVNNSGKARRIPITIAYLDGDKVLVTNGLEGVKEVVTAGSAFLTANSNIVIKN